MKEARLRKVLRPVISLLAILLASTSPSWAIPVFAHRYGLSCEVCHTTIPHLTPFGNDFLRAGFRLPPQVVAHGTFPVSIKANIQYQSGPQAAPLPKVIVDELEFLAAASVGRKFAYRIEQYAIDGGFPGLTRDAWLSYTSRPEFAHDLAALTATGGQFTLPLPVDPETQRPTINHYAIFDQTVGANPFNFFGAKIGLIAGYGKALNGFQFQLAAMKGHDTQSGLSSLDVDTQAVVQETLRSLGLTVYRYQGQRPLGAISDHFWRQAIALNAYSGKAEFNLLGQAGNDTSADGNGLAVTSSGGFAQGIWYFSPAWTAVGRYDATLDALAGRAQTVTTSLIYRLRPNMRLTVEGVSGRGHGSVNAAWLLAY